MLRLRAVRLCSLAWTTLQERISRYLKTIHDLSSDFSFLHSDPFWALHILVTKDKKAAEKQAQERLKEAQGTVPKGWR